MEAPQHGAPPGFSTGTRLDLELKGSLLLPGASVGSLYEHMQKRSDGAARKMLGEGTAGPRSQTLCSPQRWSQQSVWSRPRNTTQTLGPEGPHKARLPQRLILMNHGHFTVFPPPKPKRALWPVSKISELLFIVF